MASRLAEMQARFQQKQIQEREEKLLRLYENQQQRAFERVGRGSAGSNASVSSTGGGKVRQMFDERRQKAGIDRSYPLEPLKNQNAKTAASRVAVVAKAATTSQCVKNGKTTKRDAAKAAYGENHADESYSLHKFVDEEGPANIIEMMNRHNLINSLDDEELPQLSTVNVAAADEPYVSKKLANVGGKLPSQTSNTKKSARIKLGTTVRKDAKPIVKTTVNSAPSSPEASGEPEIRSQRSVAKMASKPAARSSAKQQAPKAAAERVDLKACRFCGRQFAEDRIQKHEEICNRTAGKKRKTYDATKHRLEGTEMATYVRRGARQRAPAKPAPKKDWRKTHEEFIEAIRSAKMAQAHVAKGGKLSDLPPPPAATNPDYVQCPHCNRRFNQAAAERHIPKCATFLHNKPRPSLGARGGVSKNK